LLKIDFVFQILERIPDLLPPREEKRLIGSKWPLREMDKMFEMATQSRKLHYSFAYRMLPLMLFGEHGMDVWQMLGDADASGPFLSESWERTAASQQLEWFEPVGLKATFRHVEERDLVVVTMPTPIAPPEAYYAIIQYDRETDKLHYYTIEFSVRLDGSKRVVLGKTLAGGQRHNLGALPTADLEMGIDEIHRKSAHLFPFRQFE
jgi:hypothetical protein